MLRRLLTCLCGLVVVMLFAGATPAPLRGEVVGWWPFDEDTEDSSGNSNDGLTFFDPIYDDSIPDALPGGTSLRLDGTYGIEILPQESLDSPSFTLAYYVLDGGQAGDFSRMTSRDTDQFETAMGPGGVVKYFSRAEGAWRETAHAVPVDTWQHLAFVSNGCGLTIYADGELVHGPVGLTVNPFGVFHIGDRFSGVEAFIGLMDDVVLFDEALSPDQVLTLAETGVEGFLADYTPVLQAPAVLTLSAGDSVIALEWSEVPDADGYRIYRSTTTGGPYEPVSAETVTETTFADAGLENGTQYFYVVSAVTGEEESPLSCEKTAVPLGPVEEPIDALVGWWTFDGNLGDRSGHGNHGTFANPMFSDDIPGAVGSGTSMSFDGSTGVVVAADPTLDSPAFTLSFFVFDQGQSGFYSRTTSREGDQFETAVGTGAEVSFFSLSQGAWTTTPHIVAEDWHHLAFVSNGVEMTVYGDGEVVYGPEAFTVNPVGFLHIGNRHNNVEGFIGLLDDVALFNVALPEDQIVEIAEFGVAEFLGNPPPPVDAPLSPTGIQASAGNQEVVLAWDPSENATGYHVFRAEAAGGPHEPLTAEPLVTTGFTDTDVANDVRYYYVVTALNELGESVPSGEVSALPHAPVTDPEAALVGWWTFDETVEDDSTFGNHGLFDAAVFEADVPDALSSGSSLRLDGASGVMVEADESLDSQVFTLSVFVRDNTQAGNFSRLTSRGSDVFETAVGSDGAVSYYSPANGWTTTAHLVPFDAWQHLAFVADGATMTVYADGEVVHGPAPFVAMPSGVLHLGFRHNSTEGFIGLLDDMALFNGELTPEWIALLATSGVAGLLDGVTAPGSVFRRGDVDGNGLLDVTDAVASLSFQFLGTFAPPCMDALDFDDNGRIELTDPIGNLTYQFGGGGEPPAPGVETCGPDPTPDEGGELGCENTPASCQ